jgi:hypothetical protein
LKSEPKLRKTNNYTYDELVRTIYHFSSISNYSPEYLLGVYETFYPWFKYREQAEDCFEQIIHLAREKSESVGHITAVVLNMIDDFKERRLAE